MRLRVPRKLGAYTQVRSAYGQTAAVVADGGTITHGLGATPTTAIVTPTAANANFIAVTAMSATTITVAIKTSAGAAGTSQKLNWWVGR